MVVVDIWSINKVIIYFLITQNSVISLSYQNIEYISSHSDVSLIMELDNNWKLKKNQ